MYTKCELEWALDHFGHHVKGHLRERVIKARYIIDAEPSKGKEFHAIIKEAYNDIKEHGKLTPKSMLHPPRSFGIR